MKTPQQKFDDMMDDLRFAAFHEAGHVVARHLAGFTVQYVRFDPYIERIRVWPAATGCSLGGQDNVNVPMAGFAATYLAYKNGLLSTRFTNDDEHFTASAIGMCDDARRYIDLKPGDFHMQTPPDTGNPIADNVDDCANNADALKEFERIILNDCVPYLRGKWEQVECVAEIINTEARRQIDDKNQVDARVPATEFEHCLS